MYSKYRGGLQADIQIMISVTKNHDSRTFLASVAKLAVKIQVFQDVTLCQQVTS